MKHKLNMLMLALAAAFLAAADTWTDPDTGKTWSYTIANNEATVTGVEPKSGTDLTIPDTLGGCPVTVIGASAFNGCSGLTGKLVLPDNLKIIGEQAFYGCTCLTGISFPEGVTDICGFGGCLGLSEVTLPESVTNIGNKAFQECRYLTRLNMPTNLIRIGDYAFSGCVSLIKLKLPETVESIGSRAFLKCTSWTGTFTVPSRVMMLQAGTFYDCSGLTAIKLPQGLKRVGTYDKAFYYGVFSGCKSLKSMTFPDSVEYVMAHSLFYDCEKLETVIFKSNGGKMTLEGGSELFYACKSLKHVVFPEGMTSFTRLDGLCLAGTGDTIFEFPSTLRELGGSSDYFNGGTLVFKGELSVGHEFIPSKATIICPRSWGAKAQSVGVTQNFMGYYQTNAPTVTIVSSGIRSGDPTIMDVKYKVASSKSTVKVRTLAFKDGERSLANVVVPKSFVEDANGNATAGNVGDGVTANEEHTLSWKVSEDWQETLANVSFEVLAVEDDVLPLELTTIPGTTEHPATIQVSWNYITGDRVFDALLWLYADGDVGITVTDGVMKHGSQTIASGTGNTGSDALVYVYSKMGYSLLQGDELTYAKNALRLDLPDVSTRQYAYKVISEK